MPESLSNMPWIVKIIGVIIGAVFALTLTGDIDTDGKLKLSLGVLIKVAFSAYFGFLAGAWVIEYMDWGHWSYASHGFVMMLCSVFGMTLVGAVYQAFKLSTTNKTPSEIITEVKDAFKAIFK